MSNWRQILSWQERYIRLTRLTSLSILKKWIYDMGWDSLDQFTADLDFSVYDSIDPNSDIFIDVGDLDRRYHLSDTENLQSIRVLVIVNNHVFVEHTTALVSGNYAYLTEDEFESISS